MISCSYFELIVTHVCWSQEPPDGAMRHCGQPPPEQSGPDPNATPPHLFIFALILVQLPIRLAKAIPTVLSLERLQNEDLRDIMFRCLNLSFLM